MAEKSKVAVPVAGITEKQVRELIAEALKGFVTEDQVKTLIFDAHNGVVTLISESIKDLVSNEKLIALLQEVNDRISQSFEDRVKELITESRHSEFIPGTLSTAIAVNDEELDLFDPTLLENLEIDGRPMTTDDILSGVMNGDVVTIISRDGQKHTITRA